MCPNLSGYSLAITHYPYFIMKTTVLWEWFLSLSPIHSSIQVQDSFYQEDQQSMDFSIFCPLDEGSRSNSLNRGSFVKILGQQESAKE
jgi:hypothetical protein